jgi:Mg-chelatase subunit ChlD
MDEYVYETLKSLLENMRMMAGTNTDLLDALDQAEDAIEREHDEGSEAE